MRRRLLVSFVLLAFAGCLAPEPSVDPPAAGAPRTTAPLVLEGAESATSPWTSRTWMVIVGDDPRPSVGRWHRSTKDMRTGEASWTFQDESSNRYHDATRYDLHSPTIDLRGTEKPVWRFYYRGESQAHSGDEFIWMIREGDGGYLAVGSTDQPAPQWTEVRVDLSPYAGRNVDLLLRFVADECGGDVPVRELCAPGSFLGYFVDDIEIFDEA